MGMNQDGLQVFSDTVSGVSDFSDAIGLAHRYAFAIQLTYTSGTGDASLQASVDNSTWTDVSSSTQSLSGTGTAFWNITACGYPFARIKFTTAASTVYTAKIFKK